MRIKPKIRVKGMKNKKTVYLYPLIAKIKVQTNESQF